MKISNQQFGFKQNNEMKEAIICMRVLIEKHMEERKDIFACFIDNTKTLNRIKCEQLF